jgi:hypothetical protein
MRCSSIGYLVILALLAVPSISCGGGGGGGSVVNPSLTVTFADSGIGSAPDLVRLTGSPSGEQVSIEVALAGPTTSEGIYAFAFDVVIGDTSVLAYVVGSARFGSALTTTGCLGETVLAAQSGDRVVVGVSKLGACPGNGVPAGERAIVHMTFRVLKAGTSTLSLAGSPQAKTMPAGEPSAFDSDRVRIESIQFDAVPATVRGM